VESITSDLNGPGSLLISQMQSNAAVKKATAQSGTESEGVGNVLNSFGNVLKEQMQHINDLSAEAGEAKQTYATGGDIELHNVILAGEKADLALQLAMQVRNKIVNAYQEISHMSV
jgi:flagellar hook-basal body complex protein FliE